MAVPKHNTDSDELLSAYIDGELTDAERAAVEARLENDPAARELVAEMRSLSGSLKALPREELAEDVRSAVLSQLGTAPVSLPQVQLSMARRFMWPAIAIAAALMLMFVQGNERAEIKKVASARGDVGERRQRAVAADRDAAFEAPEEHATASESAAAPAAPAAVPDVGMMVAEGDSPPAGAAAGAVLGEVLDESAVAARTMADAVTANGAELEGVVHLTLTDFRSGSERFNRLLVANGVQLVDKPAVAGEPAAIATPSSEAMISASRGAATLSTRSAAPMGGMGGGAKPSSSTENSSALSGAAVAEPEMVLVEAPPKQIEQILFGCTQDTEAIEDVTVDPTASGTNTVPLGQRFLNYQQYSRSASELPLSREYKVTPEQQNTIAVLNSAPKQAESTPQDAEHQQQQGWAARFYAGEQPVEKEQLNSQYIQYRHQYLDNQTRQQQVLAKDESVNGPENLDKDKRESEQPVRMLFLLHPSQEPAKK
jgi:anti-sigma factor RsiW